MNFRHKYGCVEMAMEHDYLDGHPIIFARYVGPIGPEEGVSGPEFDYRPGTQDLQVYHHVTDYEHSSGRVDPESGYPEPDTYWETYPQRDRLSADTHWHSIFNAALVLLWDEYEQFQAADAAMGDPNP